MIDYDMADMAICIESLYLCCICFMAAKDERGHMTQSPLSGIVQKEGRTDSLCSVNLDEQTGLSKTDPGLGKKAGPGIL